MMQRINNKCAKLVERKNAVWILLIGMGVYLYACNVMMPFCGDEYVYAFVWNGSDNWNIFFPLKEYAARVDGFAAIGISQFSHYFTWGGRTVAHILVQFFVWQGKEVFNICNTVVLLLSVLIVYWLAQGKIQWKNVKVTYVLWIFFAMWSSNIVFAQTSFWLTGACNYLWTTTIILFFLLPYSAAYFGYTPFRHKKAAELCCFLGGIIAGWTNENTAAVTVLGLTIGLFYFYRNHRLQGWMVWGVIGFFIGFIFMIGAPGNFARQSYLVHDTILETVQEKIRTAAVLLAFEAPLWLVLCPLAYREKRRCLWRLYRRETGFMLLFMAMGLLDVLVMGFSPVFPGRTGYASIEFLLIASLVMMRLPSEMKTMTSTFQRICIIAAGGFMLVTMVSTLCTYYQINEQTVARVSYIERCKSESQLDVTIEPYHLNKRIAYMGIGHIGTGDIEVNDKDWKNVAFARYYGLEKIRLSEAQ